MLSRFHRIESAFMSFVFFLVSAFLERILIFIEGPIHIFLIVMFVFCLSVGALALYEAIFGRSWNGRNWT